MTSTESRVPSYPLGADRDSRSYWDALAQSRLELQQCAGCRRFRWPARAICNWCLSMDADRILASGEGTVVSWITNHHAILPALRDEVPYTIVLVALAEQDDIVIPGRVSSDDVTVAAGTPARAEFVETADGYTVIRWALDPGPHPP